MTAFPLSAGVRGRALLGALVVVVVAFVVFVEPAAAATNIGKNIGEELKGFAGPVLLVLAAVVMLPLLAKRNPSIVLVVAGMAFVIGMFIFAQGAVKDMITDLATSIAGK